MASDLNTRLAAILERHPMTTAREKAEAFAASCLYGTDDSDAITHAARQLLAIVDQRFAELREKENVCSCSGSGSSPASSALSSSQSDSPFGCSRKSAVQSSSPATAEAWEPTEEQIESLRKASPIHYSGDDERSVLGQAALRYTIREALIAGHRIARESQCSNTSSAVSSPRVSFSSATTSTEAEHTAVATKPVAPTESSTPSPKSGASSLDERAEAIFAKWPELRPDDFRFEIALADGVWRWRNKETKEFGSLRNPQDQCRIYILGKLLPRAIEKWWSGSRHIESSSSVFGWKLTRAFSSGPPRDLESAIRVLEGA